MDLELQGKRALVAGGGRGIGKAIARQLALEGADVAIAARTQSQLEASAAELRAESGRMVHPCVVDIADADSVTAMVADCAEALGGIDIVVNSAALPGFADPNPATWDNVTEEDLFFKLRVKLLGALRVAQAAAPYMIANHWGRVINVAGMSSRRSHSVVASVLNVSVVAMTKNLADELAPHGINVTALHPAWVQTESTAPDRKAANLIGRLVDSSEVAYVAAFLASPKSIAMTGDVVVACGGMPGVIYY